MNCTSADFTHFKQPLRQDSSSVICCAACWAASNKHPRLDAMRLFPTVQRSRLAATVPCFSAITPGNRAVPCTCTCTWLPATCKMTVPFLKLRQIQQTARSQSMHEVQQQVAGTAVGPPFASPVARIAYRRLTCLSSLPRFSSHTWGKFRQRTNGLLRGFCMAF